MTWLDFLFPFVLKQLPIKSHNQMCCNARQMAELPLPAWCWVRVLGLKQEPGKAQMSPHCKNVSIFNYRTSVEFLDVYFLFKNRLCYDTNTTQLQPINYNCSMSIHHTVEKDGYHLQKKLLMLLKTSLLGAFALFSKPKSNRCLQMFVDETRILRHG